MNKSKIRFVVYENGMFDSLNNKFYPADMVMVNEWEKEIIQGDKNLLISEAHLHNIVTMISEAYMFSGRRTIHDNKEATNKLREILERFDDRYIKSTLVGIENKHGMVYFIDDKELEQLRDEVEWLIGHPDRNVHEVYYKLTTRLNKIKGDG